MDALEPGDAVMGVTHLARLAGGGALIGFLRTALAGSWLGGSLVKAGVLPEPLQLAARRHSQASRGLASQAMLVGLLTGIAGVGGGFGIVPALVPLAGWPIAQVSGTSPVVRAAMEGLSPLEGMSPLEGISWLRGCHGCGNGMVVGMSTVEGMLAVESMCAVKVGVSREG